MKLTLNFNKYISPVAPTYSIYFKRLPREVIARIHEITSFLPNYEEEEMKDIHEVITTYYEGFIDGFIYDFLRYNSEESISLCVRYYEYKNKPYNF